jgi:bis(5'-nucleosyl)-tetraphosphatase (symmetrical)
VATYAIGDIQGCDSAFGRLLSLVAFDPSRDRLWLVGDLVNRGAESLAVLRRVMALGDAVVTVLGNHELHLLAVGAGLFPPHPKDTFHDVLAAPDREALLVWLRHRPLLHREGDLVLLHAGLLPQWSVGEAAELAREVEQVLRGSGYRDFLGRLYTPWLLGNRAPARWEEALAGPVRWSLVVNALTKLRVCSADGEMRLSFTGPPEEAPPGFLPWFDVPGRQSADATVIFGHWAALGLRIRERVLALDSGCVYGRSLTAVRLEDRRVFQVPRDAA